jgi:hypothetical protein
MAISSNTLFHFTNSYNNLIGILKNGFIPHYSAENIIINDLLLEIAIPILSFCDIPLSQVSNHMKTYGYYGLGVDIKWAQRNRLNPVLYLQNKSLLSKHLFETIIKINKLNGFIDKNNMTIDYLREIESYKDKFPHQLFELMHVLRYIKPYKGDFNRNSETFTNYKFYNEREWRFTSSYKEAGNKLSISFEQFTDTKIRNTENAILSNYPLTFEESDVKFIIIHFEDKISKMAKDIKEIDRFNSDSSDKLISRIISCDRILQDF